MCMYREPRSEGCLREREKRGIGSTPVCIVIEYFNTLG